VTSEAAKKTEPWIEKQGVKYAYGYDPKRELMTLFNVQGIPFGALIDPFGTVVWTGHPMSLGADVIEGALAGALEKPTWQWTPELQPLAQALQREEFGKAMELARTLQPDDDLDLAALVRGRYQPLVERFGRVVDEKDWARALDLGARLETGLAGLPEREAIVARLQTIRADEEIMREVNGTARMAALEGRAMKLRDQAEAETLRADVAAFVKEQSGTKLEKRAQALLDAIDKALERARGKKG
jgi:hypothetical protein